MRWMFLILLLAAGCTMQEGMTDGFGEEASDQAPETPPETAQPETAPVTAGQSPETAPTQETYEIGGATESTADDAVSDDAVSEEDETGAEDIMEEEIGDVAVPQNVSASPGFCPDDECPVALTNTVIIDDGFYPEVMTIERGETIKWINENPQPRSVTGFGVNEVLGPGEEFEHRFSSTGSYTYMSVVGEELRGKIIVIDDGEALV